MLKKKCQEKCTTIKLCIHFAQFNLIIKTIKINIHDDLIALYGLEAIKKSLEEELAYQRFKMLENHITESMDQIGIEWDEEFEQVREEAFEEHQRRRTGH